MRAHATMTAVDPSIDERFTIGGEKLEKVYILLPGMWDHFVPIKLLTFFFPPLFGFELCTVGL